jgi:hypothetical protein
MAKAKTKKKVVSKKAGGNKSRAAKVVAKTKGPKLEGLGASSRVYSYELFGNTHPVSIPSGQAPNFYCVLEAGSAKDLAFLVQTKMNDSWIPTGGIDHKESGFFQAMIKY